MTIQRRQTAPLRRQSSPQHRRSPSPQQRSAYTASVPSEVPHNADRSWGIGGLASRPAERQVLSARERPRPPAEPMPEEQSTWWSAFDCSSQNCMGMCTGDENGTFGVRATHAAAVTTGIGAAFGTAPNGEVYFQTAVPNSSCWQAMQSGKLAHGDVIAAVDGQPVYRSPSRAVAQMLQGAAGSVCIVSFKRGDNTFTLELERRPLAGAENMILLPPAQGAHSGSSSLSKHDHRHIPIATAMLDRAEVGQELYSDLQSQGEALISLDELKDVHHRLQVRWPDQLSS